jgi:hypothetical protein
MVGVFAVIGNALILYVIWRSVRLHTRLYVLIANLALADM